MHTDIAKYWSDYNKEVLEARLKQCNLSKEEYAELKNSAINVLNGLNVASFEDAKMFYEARRTLGITFGSEGPLSYDEDIIKLMRNLILKPNGKWHITSKDPDNIRKRYPNVIDLWINNIGRNGGYTTLIRWE